MRIYIFLLLFTNLIACKNSAKFSKEDWESYTAADTQNREQMLPDLLKNYNLKGITYNELDSILGAPNYFDSSEAIYDIYVDYDKIDPWGGECIIFYIGKNSMVRDYKVE